MEKKKKKKKPLILELYFPDNDTGRTAVHWWFFPVFPHRKLFKVNLPLKFDIFNAVLQMSDISTALKTLKARFINESKKYICFLRIICQFALWKIPS